jgi:hypothetical protein
MADVEHQGLSHDETVKIWKSPPLHNIGRVRIVRYLCLGDQRGLGREYAR